MVTGDARRRQLNREQTTRSRVRDGPQTPGDRDRGGRRRRGRVVARVVESQAFGRWRLAGEAMVGSIVSTSDNKRAGDGEAQSRGREGGGVSLPSKANVLA